MRFEYQNNGDIVYGVEIFRFRYNNYPAAEIEILNFLADNKAEFAYQYTIDDSIELPKIFRKPSSVDPDLRQVFNFKNSSSSDSELRQAFNLHSAGMFSSRQEALQDAITLISAILDQHSSISPTKEKSIQT